MRLNGVAANTSRWLFAALALLSWSSPAAASIISANYKVYYMGLTVASFATSFDVRNDRYSARLDGQVSGAASLTSSFTLSMDTSGGYQNGRVSPELFTYSLRSSKGPRQTRLLFKSGDVVSVTIEPPLDDLRDRVPIDAQHLRAVIDPLSALVLQASDVASNSGAAVCKQNFRLHLGVVRADLAVSFVRESTVKTPGYRGQAFLCAVRYSPVAGHLASSPTVEQVNRNGPIHVTLASVGNGRVVIPVSATVPLRVGSVTVELIDASIDGATVGASR